MWLRRGGRPEVESTVTSLDTRLVENGEIIEVSDVEGLNLCKIVFDAGMVGDIWKSWVPVATAVLARDLLNIYCFLLILEYISCVSPPSRSILPKAAQGACRLWRVFCGKDAS